MAKTKMASETIESKNKALVLEAFDKLFNKRDYAAAERFWSPNYIQHSAHIAPGREGLFTEGSRFVHRDVQSHQRRSPRCVGAAFAGEHYTDFA
jgi:predicted SnoaL-like aldol condensation-catalyzing enzyme